LTMAGLTARVMAVSTVETKVYTRTPRGLKDPPRADKLGARINQERKT
jgi:hypothetical protein